MPNMIFLTHNLRGNSPHFNLSSKGSSMCTFPKTDNGTGEIQWENGSTEVVRFCWSHPFIFSWKMLTGFSVTMRIVWNGDGSQRLRWTVSQRNQNGIVSWIMTNSSGPVMCPRKILGGMIILQRNLDLSTLNLPSRKEHWCWQNFLDIAGN